MTISLRHALVSDGDFLFSVYASTRKEEMKLVNWNAAQKEGFLRMQFNAQAEHYRAYYPTATYHIISFDDVPAGRMIVNRSPDEILLMDIALLPEHRNAGIGTTLIRELQEEAEQTGRVLRLHVETFNPALRLYERLGFRSIAQSSFYLEMEWKALEQQIDHPIIDPGQSSGVDIHA